MPFGYQQLHMPKMRAQLLLQLQGYKKQGWDLEQMSGIMSLRGGVVR